MQRSEPGVEKDQAGADGDRQQMSQRAYGQVQVVNTAQACKPKCLASAKA